MKLVAPYHWLIGSLVLACAAVVVGDDTNRSPSVPEKTARQQAAVDSIDHVILQRLEGQGLEPQGTNLHLRGRVLLDLTRTKDVGLDTTQPLDLDGTVWFNDLSEINAVSDRPLGLVLLQPTGQSAYMGVGVESPGETLRAQLVLPEGTGLAVNYVDENGPAKNSIQKHDVLQRLDDQILVNGEQLVALVRMHKPGERVSLTLLRQARQISAEVELGAKQVADDPRELNQELELLNRTDSKLDLDAGIAHLSRLPVLGRLYSNQVEGRPITFNDGEVLASLDGHGNLLAVEVKTGKILFQGPVGTDAQWKQAPERIRQKLTEWRSVIAPGNSDSSKPAEDHKDAGEPKPQ